ncbi:terpene synthase family protein [Micromonospora sp. WMMD708]|uniref:terpene synthase family protein n=1 Tax=Micromonospora sp. WMMD708 TaxID=3403464 RepID=UPI003BF60959
METETLLLPCPFPDRSHPGAAAAADHVRRVAAEIELTGPSSAKVLHGIALGEAAALTYPDTDQERLQVATLWIAFLVLFDDAWSDLVQIDGDWRQRVLAEHAVILEVLGGRPAGPADGALVRLLGRILDEIGHLDPDFDTSRLRGEIRNYLAATLWEVDLRSRGRIPDLSSYLFMRRVFSTMTVQVELDYFVDRLHLPESVRQHPCLRLVDASVADYGCIANDLYSLDAERRAGVTSNIVIILEHEYGWTEERATAHARRMAEHALLTFQEVSEDPDRFGLPNSEAVRRYLHHYESFMSAAVRWPARSARYRSQS